MRDLEEELEPSGLVGLQAAIAGLPQPRGEAPGRELPQVLGLGLPLGRIEVGQVGLSQGELDLAEGGDPLGVLCRPADHVAEPDHDGYGGHSKD